MLKFCTRWGSCLLLVLGLNSALAQTVHIAHCLAGCPVGASAANEIVVRHLFAASINPQTGLADWVAYRVLPDSVGVASLLPRLWQADELLSQAVPEDVAAAPRFSQPDLSNQQDGAYRVTEIIVNPEDRGRLAPMSSFAGTPYWDDLNYLSNMAPIPGDLRIGPWSRLDQAVNELADRVGDVYVVSGPLYEGVDSAATGNQASNRPVAFFKFVATKFSHAAFVFPGAVAQHSNYCDRVTSVALLQHQSGLHFMPELTEPNAATLHSLLGCGDN